MNPLDRAYVPAGAQGRSAIEDAYAAAIATGGDVVDGGFDDEHAASSHELLCRAGETLIELAMIAQIFQAQAQLDPDASSQELRRDARTLRLASARVARLTRDALENHGRDTGYTLDVWLEHAFSETEMLMTDDVDPLFSGVPGSAIELVRHLSDSLFGALAAAPTDRMGVPERVASAMGVSVALYMVADSHLRNEPRLRIV